MNVDYETALSLKYMGFDEPTDKFYKKIGETVELRDTYVIQAGDYYESKSEGDYECDNWNDMDLNFPPDDYVNTMHVSAPTYKQAFEWLLPQI